MIFGLLFCTFLLSLIILDRIFLPKSARRAWQAMSMTFAAAGVFALFQRPFISLAAFLGVSRAVDIVLYVATAILIRELFLSRSRAIRSEQMLAEVVREFAMRNPLK